MTRYYSTIQIKTIIAATLLLTLSGCVTAEMRAQWAAEDHQKCVSFGAQPGDASYVACRTQLDTARTSARATAAAASTTTTCTKVGWSMTCNSY